MIRGANVVLDINIIVIVVVFLQQVRVRLQSVLQFLGALLVQFALAQIVCGSVQLAGRLPLVLRFPQLLLVLHPPVLEPRFHLAERNQRCLIEFAI